MQEIVSVKVLRCGREDTQRRNGAGARTQGRKAASARAEARKHEDQEVW